VKQRIPASQSASLVQGSGLDIVDRIDLVIGGPDAIVVAAERHQTFIGGETLALTVSIGAVAEAEFPHVREVDIDGTPATVGLRRAEA
jgi:hypothetical protein